MENLCTDHVPSTGYFLGLLQRVENPWNTESNVENLWNPESNGMQGDWAMDNELLTPDANETSDVNQAFSLPNLRVSVDEVMDENYEAQSEPAVIRSINEETGECSEQYEQNDENIFSAFKPIDSDEVSSKNTGIAEEEKFGAMEQSMRDYCIDKTVDLFKPNIGMPFDSMAEAYLMVRPVRISNCFKKVPCGFNKARRQNRVSIV